MMLVQAAGTSERAGRRVHGGEQRRHAQAVRRTTTYGKVAVRRAARAAADVPLKDPKDWEARRKRLARLDTSRRTNGLDCLRDGPEPPRDAQRRDRSTAGVWRQVEERKRGRGDERPGVKKVVRVGDSAVRRRCRHLVRAKTALEALADRVGLTAPTPTHRPPSCEGAGGRPPTQGRGRRPTRWGTRRPPLPRRRATPGGVPYPHQNHATMEPMNRDCALDRPSVAKCGTSTQNGEAALAATSEAPG